MTGLVVGIIIGILICYRLGYYDELIERFLPTATTDKPSINHLSCGECFWVTRAMWTGGDPFPVELVDQLVISVYCTEHNGFSYKRWNERHLDDKGLKNPWQTDVDNYRGFLE